MDYQEVFNTLSKDGFEVSTSEKNCWVYGTSEQDIFNLKIPGWVMATLETVPVTETGNTLKAVFVPRKQETI